jgi:hypothetical protein
MSSSAAEVVEDEPVAVAQPAEEKVILKPVPRPDEEAHKSKIEAINEDIATRQSRLTAIKESLESRESRRGDAPEVALAKANYNDAKGRARMLQQEKRNIYDQISAADELKKQQQDLTQRLKSQLSLFSVDEIDSKIKNLEHLQQTSSLAIKEDKKIMEDIKRLRASKPFVRQYHEAVEGLKGVRDHHGALYTQLKAKNVDLEAAKVEEERWKADLEAAKAKEDLKRADIPGLFKERDALKKEVADLREEQRKLRDEINERRKEFALYLKQQKDLKHKEFLERKAQRQAEYEAQKKLFEEEEAKRDPWEEEKAVCEQLIGYVEKYLPKKEQAPADEAKVVDLPAGAKAVKRGGDDDDDPFACLIKKKKGKGKGKGGGAGASGPAESKTKTMKLSHSVEDFALWDKLGFRPPSSTDECPELHTRLLEKREWLKTAPPKKKKEKAAKPKAEAQAESSSAAAAEGANGASEMEAAGDEAADVQGAVGSEAAAGGRNGISSDSSATGAVATGGAAKFAGSMIEIKAVSDRQVAVRLLA